MLEEVLCPIDVALDGREITVRRCESNLGNLVTNAMLEATHADVALLNSGDSGVREEIFDETYVLKQRKGEHKVGRLEVPIE